MNYGLPYKGSKNKLAPKIFELFPQKKNFYDLFCGGCAMTHYGMLHNKFEKYIINDINPMCPTLFVDAINGKFKNETRWISREDFLNSNEPYVKFCWSFGNNLRSYLYGEEIEPYKKALHYARVYKDFSLFEEMGIKLKSASRIEIKNNEKELKEKYIIWYFKEVLHSDYKIEKLRKDLTENIKKNSEELRQYLIDALKKSGLTKSEVDRRNGNQMSKHYFGKSQWRFPTREAYQKMQEYLPLEKDYDEIYGLQDLMQNLESLQSLQRLEQFSTDYTEIEIKKDSVIYCDIPYEGTDGYNGIDFDFERFYSWCEKQTEPVFIPKHQSKEYEISSLFDM